MGKKPGYSKKFQQVILTNKSDSKWTTEYSGRYFIQIEAITQGCVKFLLKLVKVTISYANLTFELPTDELTYLNYKLDDI